LKVLPLVIKYQFIQVTTVQHDLMVHRTCEKRDPGLRISDPQSSKKRYSTEHVSELIVLTDYKNACGREFSEIRRRRGMEEEFEEGRKSLLE
jgi:hypothetical protein